VSTLSERAANWSGRAAQAEYRAVAVQCVASLRCDQPASMYMIAQGTVYVQSVEH